DVHHAAAQKERRALIFAQRVKRHIPTRGALTIARYAGLEQDRPTQLLSTGPYVQRMETLCIVGSLFRLGHDIQGSSRWINHRRAGEPDFRCDVTAFSRVTGRYRRHPGAEETSLPERMRAQTIGVKGVDRIVLSGHQNDVVHSLARDGHTGDVERRGY